MCSPEDRYRYSYYAYGLHIAASRPIPEFPARPGTTDVRVNFDGVPCRLPEHAQVDLHGNQVSEAGFLHPHPEHGWYVANGDEIRLAPALQDADAVVRQFILEAAFVRLWLQRGCLCLHASAAVVNKDAFVFLGASGCGKSTLAAALQARGHDILSDDQCIITTCAEKEPQVVQSAFRQNLHYDSIAALRMDAGHYQRPPGEGKYSVPVISCRTAPVPLRGIFALVRDDVDAVQVRSVQGLEKIALLAAHSTHRLIMLSGRSKHVLTEQLINLSRRIPVKKIIRPRNRFTLEEMIDAVMQNCSGMLSQGGP